MLSGDALRISSSGAFDIVNDAIKTFTINGVSHGAVAAQSEPVLATGIAVGAGAIALATLPYIVTRDWQTAKVFHALPNKFKFDALSVPRPVATAFYASAAFLGSAAVIHKSDPALAAFLAAVGAGANLSVVASVKRDWCRSLDHAHVEQKMERGRQFQKTLSALPADVQLGVLRAAADDPKHPLWDMPMSKPPIGGFFLSNWLLGREKTEGLLGSSQFQNLLLSDRVAVIRAVSQLFASAGAVNDYHRFLTLAMQDLPVGHPDVKTHARALNDDALTLAKRFGITVKEKRVTDPQTGITRTEQLFFGESRMLALTRLWTQAIEAIIGRSDVLPSPREAARAKAYYFGPQGYLKSAAYRGLSAGEKERVVEYVLKDVILAKGHYDLFGEFLNEAPGFLPFQNGSPRNANRLQSFLDYSLSVKLGLVEVDGKYRNRSRWTLSRRWVYQAEAWRQQIAKLRQL